MRESQINSSSYRDNDQNSSVRELLKDRRVMEKIKNLKDDELNYVNVLGAKHSRLFIIIL
jgi:DNA-dependent RNA polymerase auxiliary subunit epsilon